MTSSTRSDEGFHDCCLEQRDVIHLEQYRDYLQHSNSLDRLSPDHYIEIMWSDPDRRLLRRADDRLLEEQSPVLR